MQQQNRCILVVDDEPAVRDSMQRWLQLDGYDVVGAPNAAAALHALGQRRVDLMLVDIRMPGMDGVELQQRVHARMPHLPVIVITAYGSVQTAVDVLKHGAVDYLTKPVDPDLLSRTVRRTIEQRGAAPGRRHVPAGDAIAAAVVGETPAMRRVRGLIEHACNGDAPVLIEGEIGTGHRTVAAAIHENSRRRLFALVPLDGVALGETPLESALYGHHSAVAGPAALPTRGKLELAAGGTLRIDHAERFLPAAQAELLQLIEEGSTTATLADERNVHDVRFIACCTESLAPLVARKRFLAELYHRINVMHVVLPALRERLDDVAALAGHLLAALEDQNGRGFRGFRPAALARLRSHDWPGNVRELASVVEHAVSVGRPPSIDVGDLGLTTVSR